ncbi:beta family protein [Bradyrhizobium sp. Arg816]|uniref:beta family protein n=1 Tax=Bradyrhizobium sp. Arg816 TaxID=2998491 RepID=UPI00249D9D4C|nr:hypothetical protein [Bradyrhizobium sp. Arg816]MDI3561244.1 hypothetical protein [Bradyrhizobium sp. Arg816]
MSYTAFLLAPSVFLGDAFLPPRLQLLDERRQVVGDVSRHSDLFVIMRWKQGERAALATYRRSPSRLHVLFEMPPAGDFDHEKQRPLTPTEHIKLFGRRLREVWGDQIAFVDAGHIDDELHKEGLTRHPLTELLERARLAGVAACPAISLSHSVTYRKACRRFVEWHPEFPICVRVEATHLDSPTFQSDLRAMLDDLGCGASRSLLVLDFKTLETSVGEMQDEFVELIADQIADFPFLHHWKGFAIALSSFPAAAKLHSGQVKEYPRTDLSLYEKLISNPKGLLRTPMYGDYALDTSPIQKPQRRTPSAHLRYSTPRMYAIAKGTSVKKPHGYEAIFPVADLLTSQAFYAGPAYSQGDSYIDGLHRRTASTGNAAKWRWASTDHHLTSNGERIAEIYGLSRVLELQHVSAPPTQGDLFAIEVSSSARKSETR